MNMYNTQSIADEDKVKAKKTMKILGIAMVILFVLTIGIVFYMTYLNNKQLKLYIDGDKISLSSDLLIEKEGNMYVSISDIAEQIGYTKNNGEYKDPYSEDTSKCYLQNEYETVSYIVDSDEIYKAILPEYQDNEVSYEYFTIDYPVYKNENKIYVSLDALCTGCNLYCSYDEQKNTYQIYTIDYLASLYAKNIPESAEIANGDNIASYKNKKAILHNMIVVMNSSGKYGVNSLDNTAIIGQKYKSITFLEGEEEFLVETDEGNYGIIDKTGTTKFSPEYTSIKQIDQDRGLYVVSKNTSGKNRYGIINKEEKVIVYIEYDEIGINKSDFTANQIENQYILYDKCIPVKQSNKWGILDLNGNTLLPIEYDGLGCTSNSSKNNQASNLLLVPSYEGIVIKKDNMYGLFSPSLGGSSQQLIIPALVTDMYLINTSGKNQYYLTYQGQTMNIEQYLKETVGIDPITETENETSNNDDNNEEETYYQNKNNRGNTEENSDNSDNNEMNEESNNIDNSDNTDQVDVQNTSSSENNMQNDI